MISLICRSTAIFWREFTCIGSALFHPLYAWQKFCLGGLNRWVDICFYWWQQTSNYLLLKVTAKWHQLSVVCSLLRDKSLETFFHFTDLHHDKSTETVNAKKRTLQDQNYNGPVCIRHALLWWQIGCISMHLWGTDSWINDRYNTETEQHSTSPRQMAYYTIGHAQVGAVGLFVML